MTYSEYISQFTIYNSPSSKKYYHRHHIVPQEIQKKLYGEVVDNRQVYLTLPQHMWAHILYDRENETHTAQRFLSICGKPMSFFTCYEMCLAYSYTLNKKWSNNSGESHPFFGQHLTNNHRKKIADSMKGKNKGTHHTEEAKRSISTSLKGNTRAKNHHWFNNGTISVFRYDCPEGYVPGRIRNPRVT